MAVKSFLLSVFNCILKSAGCEKYAELLYGNLMCGDSYWATAGEEKEKRTAVYKYLYHYKIK